MKKAVYALMLWLAALPVFADEAAVVVPQVDADPTALIVFAVVFIGMIAGFAGYIWMKERAKRGAIRKSGSCPMTFMSICVLMAWNSAPWHRWHRILPIAH